MECGGVGNSTIVRSSLFPYYFGECRALNTYLNRKGIHVLLDDRSAGDSTERSCKSTLSKDIGGRQVRYRSYMHA